MRTAFVFPGQGSQYVGMGKDLFENYAVAREVFNRADEILSFPLTELCFEGPKEELQKTVNTQPAVFAVSIAAYKVLREKGIDPAMLAGHSLGEYTALVAAKAISFEDALRLVRRRGQLMQEAVPLGTGGMLAVLGLSREAVAEVVAAAAAVGKVSAANYNSPKQVVLAGELVALEEAVRLAKKAGARRTVPLAVSGPFHSPLMRSAGEKLAEELERISVSNPKKPVVANVSGKVLKTAQAVRSALVRQIYKPIYWEENVQTLLNEGINVFIEVGPGKVLSGLVRKVTPAGTVHLNVEDRESIEKVIARLEEVG